MSEEQLGQIIAEIASKYLSDFRTESLKEFFDGIIRLKPEIKETILNTKDPKDVESLFDEISGILNAQAGTGSISVDNAIITAIQTAVFDHDQGTVQINNTIVTAPKLITGGNANATGETTIKDSTLQSKGTKITGKGFQIKMTGGARIVQN